MNVFSLKKPQEDKSKSILKALDPKKNLSARLKHMKYALENSEPNELQALIYAHHTTVFALLLEGFVQSEANFKQKDKIPRQHKEEFEVVLQLLEKLLCFMPEMIQSQWQMKKLDSVLSRLLHPGNVMRLRKEAIRLFIIYYQILGESAEEVHHATFATLIPGFSYRSSTGNVVNPLTRPISALMACSDLQPVLPSQSAESQAVDTIPLLLEFVLHFMVSEIVKIQWKENRDTHWWESFNFLLTKFKRTYLPRIFPNSSAGCDLYNPTGDIPEPRQLWNSSRTQRETTEDPDYLGEYLEQLQVHVIKWIANYVAPLENNGELSVAPALLTAASSLAGTRRVLQEPEDAELLRPEIVAKRSASMVSSVSGSMGARSVTGSELGSINPISLSEEHRSWSHLIVRETLYSSRENVNLVHEVFRQAFLLSPAHSAAVRVVVSIYRDWITRFDNPPFILEPVDKSRQNVSESKQEQQRGARLRTDTYLAALTKDFTDIRAGLQKADADGQPVRRKEAVLPEDYEKTLQIFLTHSSAVFMTELPDEVSIDLLEDQVDVCKRVLNIYRYTVMNTVMTARTWEQFLLILLQIVSTCLRERPPPYRKETLGGRLAAPLFQTLIVTWIRASLHVAVSTDLWDQLLHILSSLVEWEELIVEWGKTMDTLTRVMARYVYGLDLGDLPLERMSEMTTRKRIIKRGQTTKSFKTGPNVGNSSQGVVNSRPVDQAASQGYGRRSSLGDQMRKQSCPGMPHHASQSSGTSQHSSSTAKHGPSSLKEPLKMKRSCSESNLLYNYRREPREKLVQPILHQEKRSKSVESLRQPGPCFEDICSRTPSPSPSSGIDSSSLKETLQLDIFGNSSRVEGTSDVGEDGVSYQSNVGSRSVMAGGSVTGWTPDSTMVLWKRMLGCLGNITMIPVPGLLEKVLQALAEIMNTLLKIRENLGVSEDKQSTPPPPPLVPPLLLMLPWCIQAIDLEDKYRSARILAFEVMCKAVVRRPDVPLQREVLIHFYRLMHAGLVGTEENVINQIVKQCGASYWSVGLPGYTLLLLDFIYAANMIISSTKIHWMPRQEAVTLLGSLVCFPRVIPQLPTLQPNASQLAVMHLPDVKDHIVSILLKAGRREPSGMARGVSLCSLAIFAYEELTYFEHSAPEKMHPKVRDALLVILQALRLSSSSGNSDKQWSPSSQFQQKSVIQLASDLTLLFCDHSELLWTLCPDVVRKIIEALCNSVESVTVPSPAELSSQDEHLVISLLLCLGEWTMCLSPDCLTQVSPQGGAPLMHVIFKTLDRMISGKQQPTTTIPTPKAPTGRPEQMSADSFIPSITLDDLKGIWSSKQSSSTKGVPAFTSSGAEPAESASHVRLAARGVMEHLVQHLWHFPLGLGASHLGSLVLESDDGFMGFLASGAFSSSSSTRNTSGHQSLDLTVDIFSAPNVQFFAVNQSALISMVQLPQLSTGGSPNIPEGLVTPPSQVRFIARHLGGKTCWDSSVLFQATDNPANLHKSSSSGGRLSESGGGDVVGPMRRMSVKRPSQLVKEGPGGDVDCLDELLGHIGKTSPECLPRGITNLNSPFPLQSLLDEESAVTAVLDQRTIVLDFASKCCEDVSNRAAPAAPDLMVDLDGGEEGIGNPFQLPCLLFSQLGWASWHRRPHIQVLKKTERLLLEMKHLDQQRCRDKHKIAVIHVAEGQEDKRSILCNTGGSQDYEEFVAGLGWEVELETHAGFLGGLHKQTSLGVGGSNGASNAGETAPYFASSLNEVIFHVATRMPSNSDDALHMKTRHLGNDEVHIVWSEHRRDYHRGIFPTEFCDILIVIYPLSGRLFRIQVDRKPDVPFFGPLFDGAIVDYRTLPGLVRATAINASRAKRSTLPHFANFFVERARALESVFKNHIQRTSFEDFSAQTYCPSYSGPSPSTGTATTTPASSFTATPTSGLPERKISKMGTDSRDGPGRPPRRSVHMRGPLETGSPPNSPKSYK